jgi:hypothetical protein
VPNTANEHRSVTAQDDPDVTAGGSGVVSGGTYGGCGAAVGGTVCAVGGDVSAVLGNVSGGSVPGGAVAVLKRGATVPVAVPVPVLRARAGWARATNAVNTPVSATAPTVMPRVILLTFRSPCSRRWVGCISTPSSSSDG